MNNEEPILPQLQGKTLMIPSNLPSKESFQELQQSFDKPKLTIRDILSKTWDELDKQQVFDQIAEHLLTQSCKAAYMSRELSLEAKPRCAYRGENGVKCAIGVLIPDCEYNSSMESKAVGSLLHDFYSSFSPIDSRLTNFLRFFQGIHDCHSVIDWKRQLFSIRQFYPEIDINILDQFTWNEGENRYVRQQ